MRHLHILIPAVLLLVMPACSSSKHPPVIDSTPIVSETVQVVPAAGLPAQVADMNSNNNLDVAVHDGRVFLVFRTSATHFAGSMTRMYVLSSVDQASWTFEASIEESTDIRECRFLALNGRLFLYYSLLGTNPLSFDPRGVKMTEYKGPGSWSTAVRIYENEPTFLLWRARTIAGKAYILGYTQGQNEYIMNNLPQYIHFLTTTDGINLTPVVTDKPVVLSGGTSETDIAFTDDGQLVAVTRNEAGNLDSSSWGSRICTAPANDIGTWTCTDDPKKYDSPLVFNHKGAIYLIGRRNLGNGGKFDLGQRTFSHLEQQMTYEWEYWWLPKRCSLWKVDPDTRTATFVLDLPSKGDTCFASIIPKDEDSYYVYNYSSPVDGPDIAWHEGQMGDTNIYRSVLSFSR